MSDQLLSFLQGRMLVPSDLRQQIQNLPDDLDQLPPSRRESFAKGFLEAAWTFGGILALTILDEVDRLTGGRFALAPTDESVPVEGESALVAVRMAVTGLALRLGFGNVQKTKAATAASELARNISMYAGRGRMDFRVLRESTPGLTIEAIDNGPGISDVEAVLGGSYESRSGLGLGLRGVKSIAEEFSIETAPGRGTRVRIAFYSRLARLARRQRR